MSTHNPIVRVRSFGQSQDNKPILIFAPNDEACLTTADPDRIPSRPEGIAAIAGLEPRSFGDLRRPRRAAPLTAARKNPDEKMPNSANIVSLKPSAESKPLADLLEERKVLAAELARLGQTDSRLGEAEKALGAIDGELTALATSETAAWRTWANDPRATRPEPRRAERLALSRKREEAANETDLSRIACAATLPRQNEIAVRLKAIWSRILRAKVDATVAEAERGHREAEELAQRLVEPLLKVNALTLVLADQVHAAAARGEAALASEIGGAIERLAKLRPPVVNGDMPTLEKLQAYWRDALR
jgi:hypothetical protein